MKKWFRVIIMLVLTMSANAQTHVTKFMGIPVDGTKENMIIKLKGKGFTQPFPVELPYMLEGEFNGLKVEVFLIDNKGKMWRVVVLNKCTGENIARDTYNRLLTQFKNHKNYTQIDEADIIPETDNLITELYKNHKKYRSAFYQSVDIEKYIKEYPEFDKLPEEERGNILSSLFKEAANIDYIPKRFVWLSLDKNDSDRVFNVYIFYENKFNEPNGEDL